MTSMLEAPKETAGTVLLGLNEKKKKKALGGKEMKNLKREGGTHVGLAPPTLC